MPCPPDGLEHIGWMVTLPLGGRDTEVFYDADNPNARDAAAEGHAEAVYRWRPPAPCHTWGGGLRNDSPARPRDFTGAWWEVSCSLCDWKVEGPQDEAIQFGWAHVGIANALEGRNRA